MSRQREVRAAGLEWTVVESIPVHEVIKRGRPADKVRFSSQIESNTSEDVEVCLNIVQVVEYTANYCETMRRLARAGIPILSYSFM